MFYAGSDHSRKRLGSLPLSDPGELREGAVAPRLMVSTRCRPGSTQSR